MLNIVVCGCLFRPLASFKRQRQRRRYLRSLERFSRVSSRRTSGDALDRQSSRQTCNHEDGALPVCDLCKDVEPLSHSLIQFPTYIKNGFIHDELMSNDILRRGSQSMINLTAITAQRKITVYEDPKFSGVDITRMPRHCTDLELDIVVPKPKKRSKKEKGKTNQNHAHFSQQFIPRYRYRGNLKTSFMLSSGHSASCPDIIVHSRPKPKGSLCSCICNVFSSFMSHVHDALDFSICRSPIFMLLCFHCMLFNMSYEIPYMYIADYATDSDFDVSYLGESLLISVIGVVSTVGQIVMGYIGDRPSVNRVHFYIAMTSLAGISTVVLPQLPRTFAWLSTYCGIFGFFVSANFTLLTIILVELLGMDQLTNAYGFSSLAEGIACLIGPPIAGL